MACWARGAVIRVGRTYTAGDTVDSCATSYCGDAHFTDWPGTIAAIRDLGVEKLVPGRGRALVAPP